MMETNPAKRVYINYINNRISSANKPAEPKPRGIMGMSRTQPEQQKKPQQPMKSAKEMINQKSEKSKKSPPPSLIFFSALM